MMSGTREDYLKIVFLSNEKEEKISNKELAETFNISPASVSEMMKKLVELKHLSKDPQLGYKLSEHSKEEAKNLIRKHRLWEVFFVEKLGLNWADVHGDAEILEHTTSDLIADHLNEFLDYPMYCPHGSVIYGNGGQDDLHLLSSMKKGERGLFIKVQDSKELLAYLEHINLTLNTEILVLDLEPYDGNVIIEVEGRKLSVSHKAASEMYLGGLV